MLFLGKLGLGLILMAYPQCTLTKGQLRYFSGRALQLQRVQNQQVPHSHLGDALVAWFAPVGLYC